MLNTLAQIGSMLGIPIFIYSVVYPIYKNISEKRQSKEKEIKNYSIQIVNEMNNNVGVFDTDKTSMLKIFERVLKVKEVRLYYTNQEDKQLIDLYFSEYKSGETGIKGPLNIKCDEMGIIITLSNKLFEKRKYKKYAIEHIERIISLVVRGD